MYIMPSKAHKQLELCRAQNLQRIAWHLLHKLAMITTLISWVPTCPHACFSSSSWGVSYQFGGGVRPYLTSGLVTRLICILCRLTFVLFWCHLSLASMPFCAELLYFVIWFQVRVIMPPFRKQCPKYSSMVEICVYVCVTSVCSTRKARE